MCGSIMEEKVYKLTKGNMSESELKEEWNAIYKYLEIHSVLETKYYFGESIINLLIGA